MKRLSRLYLSPPHMSGKEQSYIDEVFKENWIAPVGPHLDQFERKFAERIGVQHAVAVVSGTAALHLLLRCIGLQPGDEVACSTFTFCASANPITYEKARPVFIDADRTSWNLDPNLLEEELAACAHRGKLPRAVIAVDLLGQSADMDSIMDIAGRYEVPVIEDAAESLGGTYKGGSVGVTCWASIFSFNGNKIITTSGGGMICTNDGEMADRSRFLATQARDLAPFYLHSTIGYNYRLSNVLAAIGLAQLEVLDEWVAARRRNFEFYREHLHDVPGITFMPLATYAKSNCWLTTIQVDPRQFGKNCEELRQQLEEQNIEARRVWKPLHTQPVFEGCRCRGGAVSESIFATGLSLPSGSAMTQSDLERVVQAVRSATG